MNNDLLITASCFGGLYLLRKLEAHCQDSKFNWVNRGTGFMKLYLMYIAHNRLTKLQLPLTSFPLYVMDKLISLYTCSYGVSVLTFIVGYPVLTSLYYYSDYLLRRLTTQISDCLVVNGQPIPLNQSVETIRQFMNALVNNRNWSLSYQDLVLKSHENAVVLTEVRLNELCPLRCPANGNVISTEDSCSVCSDAIQDEQLHRQLPCEHVFHAPCVDQWLMVHKNCPNCRRELVE